MQRRTTTNPPLGGPEAPVATSRGNNNNNNKAATLKVRRKVRRRRNSSSSSMDMEEVGSLVLIAIVTACLTALGVWLLSGVYSFLVSEDGNGRNNNRKHSKHHKVHKTPGEKHPGGDPQAVDDDYEVMPWNPIYRIPEAMETVGDRSDAYAQLRKDMDAILPPDTARSATRLDELTAAYPRLQPHAMTVAEHSDSVTETYDIHNCPDEPPPGYPFEWKLASEVLASWPVLEVDEIPDNKIHQGLCVFDYQTEYDKALRYRRAELPFVMANDPAVMRTVERWNIPGYLSQMLGKDTQHRAEYNTNSHFLYHQPKRDGQLRHRRNRKGMPPPQEANGPLQDLQGRVAELQRPDVIPDAIRMSYEDWLEKANKTHVGPEEEHWYFRLIGCGYMDTTGGCDAGSSEYLYDELPFFQPRRDNRNAIYLGDPSEQKGIHCRFGMKGVIAENHFDASRNAIVVLGGRRRYILSHPSQCENLALLPREHESARHSEIDYSDPDLERFPEFANAKANEVVLTAGQVLYLPTHWFHYIVSLDLNYQCNTRSGITHHYHSYIHDCGF